MAKITTPQNIPSELLKGYQGVLGEARLDEKVHKRYPFQIPAMQTLVGYPSAKQKEQRARFLVAKENFANVDWPTRQRWYAAMPEWGSLLWYYNYFIMSSLTGNANILEGGAGMIKSIQFKTIAMPSGAGEGQVAITAVDITKTVVMLFGASASLQEEEAYFIVVTVYPYVSSLASELVKCKWSLPSPTDNDTVAADIGIIVIEYI